MTHEHQWIDVTTISDSYERRMCAVCNREEVRERHQEEWRLDYERQGTVAAMSRERHEKLHR